MAFSPGMRVKTIAFTQIDWFPIFGENSEGWRDFLDKAPDNLSDLDVLGEFAGRNCYQSWNNPSGKDNAEYLANIVAQQHESVLEHASVTFYVDGVSRSLLAELCRHRHLSFSVVSQRYVDEAEGLLVVPPLLRGDKSGQAMLEEVHGALRTAYQAIVFVLTMKGVKRKQARETARAILPQAQETKIVVTGNLRAWRDVLKKRHHVAADAEIQEFAKAVLDRLREIAPNSVADISDTPGGKDAVSPSYLPDSANTWAKPGGNSGRYMA